jgi:MFS family permease
MVRTHVSIAAPQQSASPPRAYWYTLLVLLAYEFAYGIDLGQVSVLVKPIEQTYGIDDTQFAAIAVSSFFLGGIFVYYIGGILADTYNRRNLILASGVLWTITALAVVLTAHPWQLFTVRFVNGFAVSIGGASIFHILVDSFSRDRRTIAISVFGIGVSIGIGAGLALCGYNLQLAERIGPQVFPLIGLVHPWQLCYVTVAGLGAVVCVLLLTIREPTRMESHVVAGTRTVVESLRTFGWYMRRHGQLWVIFMVASSLFTALTYAILNWQPTFANRVYHVPIVTAAALVGTLQAVTSVAGRLLGGSLAQMLVNRNRGEMLSRLFVYFPATAVAFVFAFPLVQSYAASAALMAVAMLLTGVIGALTVNAIQDTTPNEVRGQIVGVYRFFDFVSVSIGTVGVAAVSDRFFHGGATGLRMSLALVGTACTVAAAVGFAFCVGPYVRAQREVNAHPISTAPIGDPLEHG